MITYDAFDRIVQEEIALLPEYVHHDLTGGVLIDPGTYLHPARVADDLYIMGTYSTGGITGKAIILYYGSFMATMPNASEETLRLKIRETLRHEFLHHLETMAGEKSLVDEDVDRMIQYLKSHS